MNRILQAVSRASDIISQNPKNATPETLAKLHKTLDMGLYEYARFQELKTCAVGQSLTLEEAQTIYGYLGETPEHFNAQPLAVKITLTSVFKELLANQRKLAHTS